MRTEQQIVADISETDHALIASRDLINLHEQMIVDNTQRLAELNYELMEYDHAQAQGTKAITIRMFGRPGQNITHSHADVMDILINDWYGGSQRKMAEGLGMATGTVSRLYTGRRMRDGLAYPVHFTPENLAKMDVHFVPGFKTARYRFGDSWRI